MLHHVLGVTGPRLRFSQAPFAFRKSFLLCSTVSFVIYPSVSLNSKDTMKVKSLSHTVFEKPQRTVCVLKYQLLRLLYLNTSVPVAILFSFQANSKQTFSSLICKFSSTSIKFCYFPKQTDKHSETSTAERLICEI